eukprot:ctg_365.g107
MQCFVSCATVGRARLGANCRQPSLHRLHCSQHGGGTRRPENVPGDWFVTSGCIDCDVCRWMAPSVFDRLNEQSAVKHQPASRAEELRALQAAASCPVGTIRTERPPSKELSLEARQSFPEPIPLVRRHRLSGTARRGGLAQLGVPDGQSALLPPAGRPDGAAAAHRESPASVYGLVACGRCGRPRPMGRALWRPAHHPRRRHRVLWRGRTGRGGDEIAGHGTLGAAARPARAAEGGRGCTGGCEAGACARPHARLHHRGGGPVCRVHRRPHRLLQHPQGVWRLSGRVLVRLEPGDRLDTRAGARGVCVGVPGPQPPLQVRQRAGDAGGHGAGCATDGQRCVLGDGAGRRPPAEKKGKLHQGKSFFGKRRLLPRRRV